MNGRTPAPGETPAPAGDEQTEAAASAPVEDFFDPAFLAELEGLAAREATPAAFALSSKLNEKLTLFLRSEAGAPIDEGAFLALSPGALHERTDMLIGLCREGTHVEAAQAVENFVVFFQALVPTVLPETADDIKRFFFRLAPTLLQIAHNDFGEDDAKTPEGRDALRNLETILIEISNVRLAPSEKELVFKNIDQMAAFIAVGEYAMANEAISTQLLGIIRGNKMTRALFRLMEVEVHVQVYLKEKLGYLTPQLKVPEDLTTLADYGPIRVLEEEEPDGTRKVFLQVQIPEIPILRDIVLKLVRADDGVTLDLRFDSLGTTALDVPPGSYGLGLVYQPED